MRRSRGSFAWRLTAAFVGIGLVSAGVSALLINWVFEERFADYLDQRGLEVRRSLMSSIPRAYLGSGEWDPARLAQIGASAAMQGGELDILDPAGNEVWSSTTLGGSIDPEAHREMMGGGPLGPPEAEAIVVDGETVGTAIISLPAAGVLSHDREFRTSINQLLLLGAIVAGVVALILGSVLSARAVRPARSVADAATRFAEGDRATRADYERDDEFGEMAAAFNRMADIVEDEDRMRRTFSSDIAHELRTPLAILTTQTEAMLDGAVPIDERAVASLHDEVLRLSRLVRDLETIASARAARFSLRLAEIDLDEVVRGAVDTLRRAFEESGVTIREDLDRTRIVADRDRVHQVVGNLLGNALKFTPEGGTVTVTLRGAHGTATIEVADTGRGIPSEEQDRVFDRFFRGSDARAGGSGIGLAVVQELVAAHGGAVTVSSQPGEGSTFRVSLPRGKVLTGGADPAQPLQGLPTT